MFDENQLRAAGISEDKIKELTGNSSGFEITIPQNAKAVVMIDQGGNVMALNMENKRFETRTAQELIMIAQNIK
ncbi:hypothetical protein HJ071_10050 [Vibrio parahaemolyticus]|nr:hypothetical protein [Vibrio parahaemolyticus]